ncbi:MAG: dienelactone hydrolase family protein [Holophagales bacterium]|nr:dienelactone hydrolase family protein [Holophagales bacterium]
MRTLSLYLPLLALAAVAALPAAAAVKTEVVEYKDGDQVCEGFLAYDDAAKGKRPGVVVVHDWMGVGDETRRRVKQLAELGYVALAADVYGKGIRPKDAKEAGALAGKYKGDLPALRARVRAAFDTLSKNPRVDASKVLAIGYCFGGTTAIELARSGAPLAGVVSFHGGLGTKDPADAKNVRCPILALHGAADPFVPPAEVAAFQKEMTDAKVDWQMVFYADAVHAFTNPGAGNDPSKGAAYNERADRRSWEAMKAFFAEATK